MKDEGILYLSGEEVKEICVHIDSVAIMRDMFLLHQTGQTLLPEEAYISWTNDLGESVRSLNMPGYLGGSLAAVGTKIINGNPANPERGFPRASGVTLLYDPITARVICIMDAAYISSLRTASITALAADLLASPRWHCAAFIGAGVLARAHIEVLIKRFPQLESITIFDIDPRRIASLQRELAPLLQQHHVSLQQAASAEEAIRAAQLIVPTTTTTVGYIRFEWLQPGALLVNVSLDDPLPEVVFKADSVIVDDWNLVKSDSRRLIGRMYRQGHIAEPDTALAVIQNGQRPIDAEFGEIVVGTKVGRHRESDIILVNPFGMAIGDVALATHVFRIALQHTLGLWLSR